MSKTLNQSNAIFPIRHIAEVTGVLTVTLRAWERRYGLLKPTRTAKGHRLYSETDIIRVQKVLGLLNQGIAISQVRFVLDDKAPAKNIVVDDIAVMLTKLEQAVLDLNAMAACQLIYDAGKNYPVVMVVERLVRPLKHRFSQASDALHLAAGSTLKLAMQMAMFRRLSRMNARPHTTQILFTGFANEAFCLSYDLAFVLAIEAGLPIASIGNQMPLSALAEVAKEKQNKHIVIWADDEPSVGWENKLRQMVEAMAKTSGTKIFMGGELASRQDAFLKSIGVFVLPMDAQASMNQLKAVCDVSKK